MLALDIQESAGRGDPALLDNRRFLRETLRDVLADADIDWDECHHDGTGDGLQIVTGRDVWKARLIHPLAPELAARLRARNRASEPRRSFRVRMALHAGDVHMEDGEIVGGALEDLSRLLDAPPLKAALSAARSSTTVAIAVSEHFYREVVRHDYPGIDPSTFHGFGFTLKETTSTAWMHLPGDTPAPSALSGPPQPERDTTGRSRSAAHAQYVNVARDDARVGEQIGSIGTRLDHIGGDVHVNRPGAADDELRHQLAELRQALARYETAGRLDRATYEAAEDELRAADSQLAAGGEPARSRVVLALKRLKGLVEGIAELATKVADAITAARGL
jgi:hypothetical protein